MFEGGARSVAELAGVPKRSRVGCWWSSRRCYSAAMSSRFDRGCHGNSGNSGERLLFLLLLLLLLLWLWLWLWSLWVQLAGDGWSSTEEEEEEEEEEVGGGVDSP